MNATEELVSGALNGTFSSESSCSIFFSRLMIFVSVCLVVASFPALSPVIVVCVHEIIESQ
jgi:hypothetical protein